MLIVGDENHRGGALGGVVNDVLRDLLGEVLLVLRILAAGGCGCGC